MTVVASIRIIGSECAPTVARKSYPLTIPSSPIKSARTALVISKLGKNILDSSEGQWDDGNLPEEVPLSLCIAATCRGPNGEACAVHCYDTAGTRGDVKSEDIIKIRDVGNSNVLLAGNMSRARELLGMCKPYIEAFPLCGNDVEISSLQAGLVEAVRSRKRAIASGILSAQLGVTYNEVFDWSRAHPDDSLWIDAWRQIRAMDLGAALIISTFTDDEHAILEIEANGTVTWADRHR